MATYINNFQTSRDATFRNRVRMAIVDECDRTARAAYGDPAAPTALEISLRQTAQQLLRSVNREEVVERVSLFAAQRLNDAVANTSNDSQLRRQVRLYIQAVSAELDTSSPA